MTFDPPADLFQLAAESATAITLRVRSPGPHLVERGTPLPFEGRTVDDDGRLWQTTTSTRPVGARPGACEIVVAVSLLEGAETRGVIDLALCVSRWSPQAFVLAPAMVYAGNRFDVVDVPYSPFWPDASHYAIEKQVTITRQPLLRRDGRAATIELDTRGLASPCVGYASPDHRGMLVELEDENAFGPLGLSIHENPAAGQCTFFVSTPRARSSRPAMMGFQEGDPVPVWRPGQTAEIRVIVWFFAAPRLQALFDRLAEARQTHGPRCREAVLPFSAAARLVRDKVNTLNWDEDLGYYRHGIDRARAKPYDWWQLGWVCGGITTLPMLLAPEPEVRARARRNLDFMFTGSPVANGLWCAHHDGTKFNHDDPRSPRPGYLVSVRRLGDGLYHGLKQILLLAERGEPIPTAWDRSALGLAAALAGIFERRRQVGQYLDIRSADIGIGGSCAAGIVPAGLVLASHRSGNPRYLEAAAGLARHLVRTCIETGITNGGPCDALAAPDSESCFALLVSLVTLHEATGDASWAAAARDLTRQFASWVTSRDVPWPRGSALAAIDAPATGTVWANIQNKHAAPGICTYSGEHLFRHWRATGDEVALGLLQEITHALPHYVSRADRAIGALKPGMMCERVNIGDWEGSDTVGGNIFGSTIWVETAMMLTAAEVPGVYVQTDTRRVVVFDHVNAQLIQDQGADMLRVHNPTAFDATLSIFAESSAQQAESPGLNLLSRCRFVPLGAGLTIDLPLAGLVNRPDHGSKPCASLPIAGSS